MYHEMGSTLLHTEVWGCLEQKRYVTRKLSYLLVFLQIMTGRQTVVIQPEYLADVFSKMNKGTLSFPEKQPTVFLASDKTWDLKYIHNFGKCVSITRSLEFLILKDFSDEVSGNINKCNVLILCIKICQYLEKLNNSANRCFPTENASCYTFAL